VKINLITTALILAVILLGIGIMQENSHRNAQLNEYELLMTEAWQCMDNCKKQLGAFYMEEK